MKDIDITKEELLPELERLQLRVTQLEETQVHLKDAERALRETEQRFQSFMNSTPAIAFMKDDRGRFLYVNRRWEQEFNRTLAEVQGLFTEEVWPGKGGIEYRKHDKEVLDSGETLTFVEETREPDGSTRYWWTVRFPVPGYRGEQCTGAIAVDITAQKKAEEALRESEAKLRLIAETVEDVFWMSTPDISEIIYVSPSYEKLWGRPCESLYESPKSFMEAVHPDDRARVDAKVEGHAQGHWDLEYRIVRPDGTVRWIRDRGFPVRDESGNLGFMTGVATDITLRKEAEADLKKARDELELQVRERTAELKTANEDLLNEIAERRAAENAIGENEELLVAVLDALPDVVGVQLPDHTVTRYNRAGYELLGLAPEQVHGRKCYELLGRSDQCTTCATAVALKTKNPEALEKYVPELGRCFWCSSSPLLDQNGDVRLIIERLVDITDRKKMEEALKASEARYRFLAEHANDVLWTVDLNMRTTYVSPSIERVLGFTPEERMQQSVEDQLTPESLELARKTFMEELNTEREQGIRPDRSTVLELDYLHKNGSVVCLESVIKFIRDDDGVPIGIHGLSRDITDRKKAEEALRRSEEFNRRLVERAPFGIIYFAGDGTIEYANPAADGIAGNPEDLPSPVLGKNIAELPGLQDRSKVHEYFRRLLKGESISGVEVPYKSSAGRDTVLLSAATPRFASDGTVTGGILMFTDIAELKKAEEIQRQAARFRAVADLAGGVAHNFNNLLQIVIGNLELALIDLEAEDYPMVGDALERVLDSSRFGAEIVRRLQVFAREGQPFQVSRKAVFDLSDVAKQAAEVSRSWLTTAEKEGIKISLHTRLGEGCFVKADENEIFGVIVNLVRNAIEAMPAGGDIDLTDHVEGDKVVLRVKDTGIGMGKEDLGRVFNPFFTRKTAPGAGLSSASGRRVVEDCGGRILVESVEGHGSTFTVVLPLAEKPPEPIEPLPERGVEQPLTILVIDDMEAITDLMKSALSAYGHAVLTALSGHEGIAIFEENPTDVVICDLGMPGMTGWEVGKRIRTICRERGVSKTPFILITAWARQELEAEKIAGCGVDAVVGKPLKIRTILEVIGEVVESRLPRDFNV